MTSYPVNYAYDRHDGSMFDGMAATETEARTIMEAILTDANGTVTALPTDPSLTDCEAGPHGTREQIETWWADEIEAGWAAPAQVYGGYVARVTYWTAE